MHDTAEVPLDELPLRELLEPISESAPTGEPQDRWSSPLIEIAEARDSAEKCEIEYHKWQIESAVEQPSEKPDWNALISPAVDLLKDTSKDLRVAAWLGEAVVRRYGVSGLKEALMLCSGLAIRYWIQLHPQADEDDGHEAAVSGLKKLFGSSTVRALDNITFLLADPQPNEPPRYATFDQARNAKKFDQITDQQLKEKRRDRFGWISSDEFQRLEAATSTSLLQRYRDDLSQALELSYEFGDFLRKNCRPDRYGEPTAPESEFLQFRGQVEAMLKAVEKQLESRGVTENSEQDQGSEEANDAQVPSVPARASSGVTLASFQANGSQAVSREEAFRLIEEIASFFEKHEPNSPVHFGLRQVVRWGRMSFPDLLRELLENEESMKHVGKRVGFAEKDQNASK